jgi:2-polyprenyl-6-methoxyphenol hydroxylase-like FAD-dependent oxidoreductase
MQIISSQTLFQGETEMTHAIVIGSSIAGLTAARVLSNHFDKITIIDRDTLPGTATFRKGVPQSRHAHIVLRGGLDIMEKHFPGLTDDLRAVDSPTMNAGKDVRFFMDGKWRNNYEGSQVETVMCSRPMLESTVYRHLLKNPTITVIQDTDVVGLCMDDTGTRATGVQLRYRGRSEREAYSSLDADLIVDASGRDSKAPEWLASLGFVAPEETEVNAHAGYASRTFEPPANWDRSWKIMVVQASAPDNKRGCVLLAMEGHLWQIVLLGIAGDYPPTDEEGFMEFLRSLPTPEVYNVIKEAKPLSPIYGYRRTENRLRHYDKLPRHLENFLVMGDAVCCFNPVYGQGMTVASMESVKLEEVIGKYAKAGDFTGLAKEFQKAIAGVIALPWQLASGEDLRWVATEPPAMPARIMQWYIDNFMQATFNSKELTDVFYQVQNMMVPATKLFRPDVMLRVLATRLMHRN